MHSNYLYSGNVCPCWIVVFAAIRLLPVAMSMIDLASWLGSLGRLGSFCVALRFEPRNLSVAGHPIVNVSFADKAADNPNFGARDTGLNLPVSFSDPFWLECDAR
jgi:hypothetical protein